MTALQPGIHYGLSDSAYHADPFAQISLSSSIGKLLIAQSPLHAWINHPRLNPDFQSGTDKKFDVGQAAHALLLDDRPERCMVIDADDYRTSAARSARDEAIAAGRLPLLRDQHQRVTQMLDAARRQLEKSKDGRAFLDASGASEVTLGWLDRGAMCRARVDRMTPEFIFDFKTTGNAAPSTFGRIAWNLNYRFQMQFYLRGHRACFPKAPQPQWRTIAQETEPPYGLAIFAADDAAAVYADHDVDLALSIWRECMASGVWPGYPAETAVLASPAWAESQFETAKQRLGYRDPGDSQAVRDMLFQWYAPADDASQASYG